MGCPSSERSLPRLLAERPLLLPACALWLGAALPLGERPLVALLSALGLSLTALLRPGRTGALLLLFLGFAALGNALATWAAGHETPGWLHEGGRIRLEGRVRSVAPTAEGDQVATVDVHRVGAEGEVSLEAARFAARLRVPLSAGPLHAGERVRAVARLRPVHGPSNPGERDLRSVRRRRAIRFTGGVDGPRLARLSPPPTSERWLRAMRERMALRAREGAPSEEAAALFLALSAGLRAELGADVEERFARSGLAHVLSVSGLHVAALALMVLAGGRWLLVATRLVPPWRDSRRWVAAPSALLVWGYVAFTGWQLPAVRSAAMTSVWVLSLLLARKSRALDALCLAALLVVIVDPSAVADLSMRLSFAAVLALILLSPVVLEGLDSIPPFRALRRSSDPGSATGSPERGRPTLGARVGEACVQTFAASVAATLASLPLVAAAFHRLSLAGLVSNVAFLPLGGVLTLLSALAAALYVVAPGLAGPVIDLGTHASELLLWMVDLFAALPFAAVSLPSLGGPLTATYYLGLLAWAVGVGAWRRLALLTPLALLLGVLVPLLLAPGLSVTFLAVGHGDAVVISSGGEHALVDGGGMAVGADTGDRFVVPFLRERGISSLALAVVSHPHLDHVLGVLSTIEQIPTARVWVPPASDLGVWGARLHGAGGAAPEEASSRTPPLRLGEAELEILAPAPQPPAHWSTNDRSLVLRIRHGEVTVLLTGDIEADGERGLEPGQVTVLKAPHHGSRTSSSPALIARTRPRHVVFCVGREDRFGHPHAEVVERYRSAGARCWRTDLHGAITFESDGSDVRVRTFLPGPAFGDGPPGHEGGGALAPARARLHP